MRRALHLLLACAVLVALATPALAQHSLRAYVQPDRGITDTQPIQFVLQLEGSSAPQVKPPRLRGLTNLTVLSGPNTNTSMSWSNGRQSAKYTIYYTLLAQAPGPAEIPGFEITVDGTRHRVDPIRFNVEKGVAGNARDPRSTTPAAGTERRTTADVFVQATLSDLEAWVGEPVTLEVTIFSAVRITNPVWHQVPSFGDFWVEELEVNPDDESYQKRIDGRVYRAFPVERKLLIPLGAGEFEIESYVAQMQLRLSGNDLFDMLSRGRSQPVVRKTEPLTLKVRSLPGGAPPGFTGAVGDYDLTVELDRTSAAVSEAIALRATVSGTGSLRSVTPPQLDFPASIKAFDPKLTESISTPRAGGKSRKSWEWVLVPLTPGEIQLPALTFPYFDPAAGAYRQKTSPATVLTVRRGEGGSESRIARGDISLQNRDLAFIKRATDPLRVGGTRAHQSGLFVASTVLPLVLAPLFIVAGRMRARREQDQGKLRIRRARALARKRLQSVRKGADELESSVFHEEVARTLVEFVADHFNLAAAGLTYDLVDEMLISRGVDPTLRRRFRSCLETCDFARFVPSSGASDRRVEVLDEATAAIDELEQAL